MCGICLLLSINFENENDINTLQSIKMFNSSFDDEKSKTGNVYKEEIKQSNTSNGLLMEENLVEGDNFYLDGNNLPNMIKIIANRGPDYLGIIELCNSEKEAKIFEINEFLSKYGNFHILFEYVNSTNNAILISSVLSLRGIDCLTTQPIYEDKTGNCLQYNGEIFKINQKCSDYDNCSPNLNTNIKEINFDLYKQNDGLILSHLLNNISLEYSLKSQENTQEFITEYSNSLFNLLNQIESDHAFIFHDRINKKIVINRDIFGKRSLLLMYFKSRKVLVVASAITSEISLLENTGVVDVFEVPSNSLLIINMNLETNKEGKLHFYKNNKMPFPSLLRFPEFEINAEISDLTGECFKYLRNAVFKRVCNLPEIVSQKKELSSSVAVLFSGGIDSLLLAYFTIINLPPELSENIAVDLINLSFDKEKAPDRNSGLIAYYELKNMFPYKKINLILVDKSYDEDVEPLKEVVKSLIFPKQTHMDFNIATALKLATQLGGKRVKESEFLHYMNNFFSESLSNINESNIENYNNNILSNKLPKIDYSQFIENENYRIQEQNNPFRTRSR